VARLRAGSRFLVSACVHGAMHAGVGQGMFLDPIRVSEQLRPIAISQVDQPKLGGSEMLSPKSRPHFQIYELG
jgi:hypothetical protein